MKAIVCTSYEPPEVLQLIESNGGCALWKKPERVKSIMEGI